MEIDCLTGNSLLRRVDIVMDVGKSVNPALDIGQIEGAFMQGFGWSTMEELAWGDKEHTWIRPGQLFTRGPGTYKIPAFNDAPLDMRVHLSDTENKFCVHSSQAIGKPFLHTQPTHASVCLSFYLSHPNSGAIIMQSAAGEPPFFLGASAFFALQAAAGAAREETLPGSDFYLLNHPATSERIRMACSDRFTARLDEPQFKPKGSY